MAGITRPEMSLLYAGQSGIINDSADWLCRNRILLFEQCGKCHLVMDPFVLIHLAI